MTKKLPVTIKRNGRQYTFLPEWVAYSVDKRIFFRHKYRKTVFAHVRQRYNDPRPYGGFKPLYLNPDGTKYYYTPPNNRIDITLPEHIIVVNTSDMEWYDFIYDWLIATGMFENTGVFEETKEAP